MVLQEFFEAVPMDTLRVSSQKVVDTLAHSQSSTNMSKSISGASLASSQTTQRTKCSSGFSSTGEGSTRSAASNASQSPGGNVVPAELGENTNPAPRPIARGGGHTVLEGISATMSGKLRRRARFSGWRSDSAHFELRSSALISFAQGSKGTGHHINLSTLASKVLRHPHSARQVGDWNWSVELAGAERVAEVPALSRKGTCAFVIEWPAGSRRRALLLAADTPSARSSWIRTIDRARRCVKPKDFQPLSVIGEGHFGKVLLVKWLASESSRKSKAPRSLPSVVVEEEEEGDGSGGSSGAPGTSKSEPTKDHARLTGDGYRYLAVKEVALHKGSSLPGVLNERQILGVLEEHPFVVTLRCAWRRGNFLYYGLDFMPGADLFELFRRQSIKMDASSARMYAGQMALALEHLHSYGIVYRDLKPENILVDATGHLRLADMGLSKVLGIGEQTVRTSTVCGTRAYLAPEMVLRKPYGFSVDFWQFGCFLFELYAGHSPFWTPRSGPPGRANDQTVALILAGEITYPRSMEDATKAIVRALLHPDADARIGCRPSVDGKFEGGVCSVDTKSSIIADNTERISRSVTAEINANGIARLSGWEQVRAHRFFADLDWEALKRKELKAPLVPGLVGRNHVGNFSSEYTKQRAHWGGDVMELRDSMDKDGLFGRELLGFDFVRD